MIPIDIRTPWKKFHTLKQFNWIHKEIMPGGWVPRCTYGRDCIWYGKSKQQRVVSDEQDNYVLNATERFFYTFFSKSAKYQKDLGVPNKEQAQDSYFSTCNHILEHMRTKDLNAFLMFPLTLTKRAEIDN